MSEPDSVIHAGNLDLEKLTEYLITVEDKSLGTLTIGDVVLAVRSQEGFRERTDMECIELFLNSCSRQQEIAPSLKKAVSSIMDNTNTPRNDLSLRARIKLRLASAAISKKPVNPFAVAVLESYMSFLSTLSEFDGRRRDWCNEYLDFLSTSELAKSLTTVSNKYDFSQRIKKVLRHADQMLHRLRQTDPKNVLAVKKFTEFENIVRDELSAWIKASDEHAETNVLDAPGRLIQKLDTFENSFTTKALLTNRAVPNSPPPPSKVTRPIQVASSLPDQNVTTDVQEPPPTPIPPEIENAEEERMQSTQKSIAQMTTQELKEQAHYTGKISDPNWDWEDKDEYLVWKHKDALFPAEVQVFFSKNKENPFISKMNRYFQIYGYSTKTMPAHEPEIASPNRAALELIARKYEERYGIQIHVLPTSDLANCIREIDKQAKEPTVVGFVAGEDEETIDKGHVAPMVGLFVPGQKPQFILMDVLSEDNMQNLLNFVPSSLPEELYEERWLVHAPGGRQADRYSCRMGAITMLRNALLSFKTQENQKKVVPYWNEVFNNAQNKLPPDWTYVEQRQLSTPEERSKAPAIRDKFSKIEGKRQKSRSAQDHITATSEEAECCIFCPFQYSEFSQESFEESLKGAQIPEGARLEITDDGVILKVRVSKQVNTYLLRKGQKERKRLQNT